MITSKTIAGYAAFTDRTSSYDDDLELVRFTNFLQSQFPVYTVLIKPDGPYHVDIGVNDAQGNRVSSFDLERCQAWTDDWPAYWKSLSFLCRKDKYLPLRNFHMVWWNASLSRCVIARGKDIANCPPTIRTFKNQSHTDRVRCIPFALGTLIGTDFRSRELSHFDARISYDFNA